MILCTENDNDFIKYKDKVKNRKVTFTIKQIFKDWWNKFLNNYPNLNIRNVVFLNVERMLKCQSWDLGYAIFKCPECNRTLNVACTCKSNGNTAMSFSLFLLNFADSLEKIEID